MWSHARGLLSPSTIFGGGTKGGANKREDSVADNQARVGKKKKRKKSRAANTTGCVSSGSIEGEVASQVSHQVDDSERAGKIQNASNSSGDGGGGGGSSSGYTSQLSGAPASLHQQRRASTTTEETGDNMSVRLMQNGGDLNNNNNNNNLGGKRQMLYQSHLIPRPPMVPMMIDDDDDDVDDDDDDEQAIDLHLDDEEDLAGDHLSHRHHRQHSHHHRSLQLIDGLRQQHEMRYTSSGQHHNHLHFQQQQQQLDDKLSLANSIMFHDGVGLTPHNHQHQHQHHHHQQQQHFSLPPPTNTTTTSRGTTLLAYSGGGGHDEDHGDCATAVDSDATNLSSAHHHHRQNHLFHQYSNNNHRLAYEAADLRPHLRGIGDGKSNLHLTSPHHHLQQQQQQQQDQNSAIYYQPNLVNGQVNYQHHRHSLAESSNGARHLRSGSFLQFQSAKPPAVPPLGGKTGSLISNHQTRTNFEQTNQSSSYNNHHNVRHTDYPGKLGSSTTGNICNNSNKKNGSTFKLAGSINAAHQMMTTNRMHHTNTPRHHQQQQQSNNYLAAPDTSDSSHTSKQQVRRSRSNQQLSVSPTRAQTTTRVLKSASSGGMAAAAAVGGNHGPALVAPTSQINANLAAISSSGAGRRSAPHDMEPPPPLLVLGCCGKLAKFLLMVANILFWSAGIALGAWGILALVDDHKYNLSQLLVFDSNTRMSLFQLLAWSFITLGCATILVGVCGCSAMLKNSRWILGLYIFLILAIFALDLATGLLAMIFQERLVANVRLRLVNKLRNEYGLQASFTAAIDYIQTKYECCGLDGHFDYDQSLWRLQRLGGFEATVARTCCHLRNTFDDQAHVNPRPVNESMCQSTDVRFHQSYRYRRGCLDDLERLIRHKIWTFTIGCGIVGGIILLSLALATCFCRSIPSGAESSGQKSARNGSASRKSSANRVHQQALAYVENVSKKQGQHHHHSSSSHYR